METIKEQSIASVRTVRLYKFHELASKIKIKVCEKWREGYNIPTEYFKEIFEDYIKQNHPWLDVDKFNWRLGYSQGDGVSFDGCVNLSELEKHLPDMFKHLNDPNVNVLGGISFKNGSTHYCHAKTIEVDDNFELEVLEGDAEYISKIFFEEVKLNSIELQDYVFNKKEIPSYGQELQRIVDWVKKDILDASYELEKEGYKLIEDMTSDKTIGEEIANSDIKFLEDGRVY